MNMQPPQLLRLVTARPGLCLRRKKRPTLFFSADPIIFSTRLTVRPYFLWVVAGCWPAAKMASVTLIIEKTMKKYSKKLLFPTYRP